MAGKITTILAKREAETYCTQGLHKEALHIYHRLIATTPNIDPALKAGIENQIEKISAELESEDIEEAKRMTADDIRRVKKGWGEGATESDMIICAQAFCQIGCYEEALNELADMLRKGCATKKTPPLVADCLANMCPPEELVDIIEKIINESFSQTGNQFDYAALLAQEMVALKHPRHARAILAYLREHPNSDGDASQRLAAIADGIEGLETGQMDAAPNPQAAASEQPVPAGDDIPNPVPDKRSPLKEKIRSFIQWLPCFGRRS
jgi:thioredoxin-like negative regulator of GroEL